MGNARTFIVNWLLARTRGWRIVLRIEDLDGPRVKPGADVAAIDDLKWLGIDWDTGPTRQSDRADAYRIAVDRLLKQGDAYPCICTRAEIESAASAPHAEDGSPVYPGTCRGRFASVDEARRASPREPAIRFAVPRDRVMTIRDQFAGERSFDVSRELGDFVIYKNDGTAAYQLAVVIDDADAGVTQVVRGDDLLDSAPRQVLLYEALARADRIPTYTHLPLVVGPDGRRLAKRHGDSRLSHYRAQGFSRDRVLRRLAPWCGVDPTGLHEMSLQAWLDQFDERAIPREAIVYGGEWDSRES
jgi:glutamyl-tRNA synthetase